MLDTVLRTKVLAINVKVNISKPFDAVKTSWNHHNIEDKTGKDMADQKLPDKV